MKTKSKFDSDARPAGDSLFGIYGCLTDTSCLVPGFVHVSETTPVKSFYKTPLLVEVKMKRLDTLGEMALPSYETSGSAGMDLRAVSDVSLFVGKTACVPCGFEMELPMGCEAQVRSRSGLALKHSVSVINSPGTIDSDYRGEVCVLLQNTGDTIYDIKRGDRIAQMVIAPVSLAVINEVDQLDATDRGDGGFGSTGK